MSKESFPKWWIKKVIRLYIPLTVVNIITILIGFRRASVSLFLFPVGINLWYVPVISVLYIPYSFIVRADNTDIRRIRGGYRGISIFFALIVYVILYLVRYRDEFFVEPEIIYRVIYGFIGMMIGSFMYDKKELYKSDNALFFMIMSIFCCGGVGNEALDASG